MARGSLAGIVSGVVVSGLALGVASLSVPPVEMGGTPPAAEADGAAMVAAEAVGAEEVAAEEVGSDAVGAVAADSADTAPAADREPMPETAAEPATAAAAAPDSADAAEPEAPVDAGAAVTDVGTAPEPETAAAPEADPVAEPLTGAETGSDPASAPADTAAATAKRGEAAEAEIAAQPTGTPLPETDSAPQMESDPVKVPMVDPEEPAAIPGMELVEKLPPALPPASDSDQGPAADEAPEAGDMVEPATVPDTSDDKAPGSALTLGPEPAAEPEPAPEPEAEPEPETVIAAAPEPAPQPEPVPEIPTIVAEPAPERAPDAATPAPETAPDNAPDAAPDTASDSVLGPAPEPGLSGADTVVTGRLPRIGDEPAAAAPVPEAAMAALPAIERNRIDFTVEGDQPLLALLLLDSGDRAALADIGDLPFPLTVAVNAGAPDAAEAIAFYDTRGIEVALVLPLPDGAAPADVDVTVQAYGPLLDQAAEVVAEASLGFQALGPGALQLATNLAESGHGLVSFPSGLNTGHKSALKQGVPAGLVFLDLDGEGQGGPVIRRFLDNAAFRARNENGVIVLARTRDDTLQALMEWSLGNRAQTVTLAPISAVLLAQ